MSRSLRFLFVSAIVMSAGVAMAEGGRRILDGYRIWSVDLVRNPSSVDLTWSNGRFTDDLLRGIPLDAEVSLAW